MLKHSSGGVGSHPGPCPQQTMSKPSSPRSCLPLLAAAAAGDAEARGMGLSEMPGPALGSSSSSSFQVMSRVTEPAQGPFETLRTGMRNGRSQADSRQSSMQSWTIPDFTQIGQVPPLKGLSQTPLMAGCLSHVSIPSSFGAEPGILVEEYLVEETHNYPAFPGCSYTSLAVHFAGRHHATQRELPPAAPHKPGGQDAMWLRITKTKRGLAPKSRMLQARVPKIPNDVWGGFASMHHPPAARREQHTGQPTWTSLPRNQAASACPSQLLGALRTPAGPGRDLHGGEGEGVQLCCHASPSTVPFPLSIPTQSTQFAPSRGSPGPCCQQLQLSSCSSSTEHQHAPTRRSKHPPPQQVRPQPLALGEPDLARACPPLPAWGKVGMEGMAGEEKTRANPFAADFKVIVSRSLRNSLSTK